MQIAYTTRNTLIGVVERRRADQTSGESTTRPPVTLQDRIRRNPHQLAAPPPDLVRFLGYGVAIVKASASVVIAVLALPQLFSGDSFGWGIVLLAIAASGFWSAHLLYLLAPAPTNIVGSVRQKTLYTLLLLFEVPGIPFIWPFFIRNWLPSERRLASAARVNETKPSDSDDKLVLRTHDITVNFGGNIAVDHVDIDVRRDEIVGLIGTNGAGKSTFMNAIGGYVPSSAPSNSSDLTSQIYPRPDAPRKAWGEPSKQPHSSRANGARISTSCAGGTGTIVVREKRPVLERTC